MTCCLWVASIGFGRSAGYGSPAVMSATSVEFTNGAVVGRRPIDVTTASAETDP